MRDRLQPIKFDHETNEFLTEIRTQPFVPVEIGNEKLQAQLDTGASTNLIPFDLVKFGGPLRPFAKFVKGKNNSILYDVQGNKISQNSPPVNLLVTFGRMKIPLTFKVVENLSYPIIGAPSMVEHEMSIVNQEGSSYLLIGPILLPKESLKNSLTDCEKTEVKQVVEQENFLSKETQLKSEIQEKYHTDLPDSEELEKALLKYPLDPGLAEFVLDGAEPSSYPEVPQMYPHWEEDLRDPVKKLIPESFLEEFIQFIKLKAPTLFSKDEYDCGMIHPKYGKIDEFPLTSQEPIFSRPYSLNSIRAKQIENTMLTLEKHGLVERGNSPYGSCAIVVPKSDGRIRVVIDYRRLNTLCQLDTTPVPRMTLVMQNIADGKPKYFTCVDITNAFQTLPLGEKAKMQAAIVTPYSTFKPTRLPFGLKNAPSLFLQAMSKVIRDMPRDPSGREYCISYFDDLLIYSQSYEDHKKHIMWALETIYKAGLKIQASKIEFFKQEIKFLGKILTPEGVKPLPRHVTALKEFPTPHNIKTLQSFLGLAAWNSMFFPKYALTIAPLTQLLKKEVPFIWGKDQQQAFEYIKSCITEATISYFCDPDLPLYVCTDASETHISGVVYQVKSYSSEKIPEVMEILKERNLQKLPPPDLNIQHPLLPKGSLGNPMPFRLTGDKGTEVEIGQLDDYLGQTDKLHVICNLGFYCSSLSKAQRAYPIIEKEAYAIVQTLTYFDNLISRSNNKVYLLTDTSPFLYLVKLMKTSIARLQRWTLKLSSLSYDLIMCHIKGAYNVADHFTRVWVVDDSELPKPDKNKAIVINSPFAVGQVVTLQDVIDAVDKDPDCVKYTPKQPKRLQLIKDGPKISKRQVKNPKKIDVVNYVGTFIVQNLNKELTLANFISEQQKDTYCQSLKLGDKFYEFQGLKYYKNNEQTNLDSSGRIVVPAELENKVIASFHVENHSGIQPLYAQIKSKYYFPDLFNKVKKFTELCHLCAVYKSCTQPKTPLAERELEPAPCNYIWSIDVVEGMPTYKGSTAYLSMVEYYSGYRLIVALKYKTATEIRNILETYLIAVFGPPVLIISDGGSNLLKSNAVKTMLSQYGVQSHITTPYSPKSHGRIEVSHKAITILLNIASEMLNKSWYVLIPFVQIALNCRPSSIHRGLTPFFVMFGREVTPIHMRKITLKDLPDPDELTDIWKKHEKACTEIIKAYNRLRNKLNQKKGGKFKVYPKGTYIWAKNFGHSANKKTDSIYLKYPLRVVKDLTHTILASDQYGVIVSVHKDNLKECKPRDQEMLNSLPKDIQEKLSVNMDRDRLHEFIDQNLNLEVIQEEENELPVQKDDPVKNPLESDKDHEPVQDDSDEENEPPETDVLSKTLNPEINKEPVIEVQGIINNPRNPDRPLHMQLRSKRVSFDPK